MYYETGGWKHMGWNCSPFILCKMQTNRAAKSTVYKTSLKSLLCSNMKIVAYLMDLFANIMLIYMDLFAKIMLWSPAMHLYMLSSIICTLLKWMWLWRECHLERHKKNSPDCIWDKEGIICNRFAFPFGLLSMCGKMQLPICLISLPPCLRNTPILWFKSWEKLVGLPQKR